MNKGERISSDMVVNHLNINNDSLNDNFPVKLNDDSDKLERELILKQLLFIRQDINDLKQALFNNMDIDNINPTNPSFFLPSKENTINEQGKNIDDAKIKGIKDDVIGEIQLKNWRR